MFLYEQIISFERRSFVFEEFRRPTPVRLERPLFKTTVFDCVSLCSQFMYLNVFDISITKSHFRLFHRNCRNRPETVDEALGANQIDGITT